MTRKRIFRIKNAMLLANLISNVIGVSVVIFLTHSVGGPQFPEIVALGKKMNSFFIPLAFIVPIILTILYERPIRRHVNAKWQEGSVFKETSEAVLRRLLNEPFFLIAMDMAIWLPCEQQSDKTIGGNYPCVEGCAAWPIRQKGACNVQ